MTTSLSNLVSLQSDRAGALLLARPDLHSTAPHIEGMLQDLLQHLQERQKAIPMCPAVTVRTAHLRPLLEAYWAAVGIEPAVVSTETLVLYLPPMFEAVVGPLATTSPEVLNYHNLDFRGDMTYLSWKTVCTDEKTTPEIWVPERPLCDAICSAFRYEDLQAGWMSVVMCAGESVAIGGFVVDDNFMSGVQATSLCRGNVEPDKIYAQDEIQKARDLAAKVGPTPWVYQLWSEPEIGTFLAADVYACTPG